MVSNLRPDLLGRALSLASELHADQFRKGTDIPYVAHLLGVAALVLEDGGTEDEVIAALLHDAAEDQGGLPTLRRIESLFGSPVAEIVAACSDSLVVDRDRKKPWRERKESAIQQIAEMDESALRVVAADKLHNVRTTAVDLEMIGAAVWARFKSGREGFLWYHREAVAALESRIPESRSVRALRLEVKVLDRQAGTT